MNGYCISYDFAGEYRKIVQAAPKVIALLDKTPKKFEFFDTPVDLYPVLIAIYGHALGYVGEFAQAEKECERALILAQQSGNPYSLGWVEFMYGCQYLPKGDGRNAVKHLHNSTGYFEKVGALAVLQVAWSLLASGYSLLGESDNALEYFRKMHEVQTDIESPGFLSLGHLASSSAYLNSGNLDEAKVHAEKALNLGQTHHERYCEGSSWLLLGRIVGKMEGSNLDEAEECILNGMKILDELETKPAYAVGCLNLAELYMRAGRKEKALENLRRSQEMFSQMGMDQWLERVKNLAG